uniref:Pentatricopeptide repeat-containing protein n=1 Tax=Salix viminalis TaxID=40686 RepID=A0A6N2KN95_SALVM
MIIGLAKCGEIDNSWRLFDNMVLRRTVSWKSTISKCVGKGRFLEATDLFRRTKEERISLRSLHCHLEEAMQQRQIDKEPRCSSIEVNGEVHELVAGGRLHPRSKEIYHESDDLGWSSMAMG